MKKNVVLLFGGQSTEHDISRRSVMTFIEYIDQSIYEVYLVGITREGQWSLFEGDKKMIMADTWLAHTRPALISPDAVNGGLLVFGNTGIERIQIDVVIPVLHGLYGEDGSVQGLLRLAKIPTVGCGLLASAVAMDKCYTKLIVDPLNIRQARYVKVLAEDYDQEQCRHQVEEQLGYPVFVKPSNAGSSIGVSKADDAYQLHDALLHAFKYDRKVLVEENILGREVECAVLGNLDVMVSDVGEIIAEEAFYDFDAKYNSQSSKTVVGAVMPDETRELIRAYAVKIFKAIDGRGLSRVDFFIEEKTGEVVFNEINTFPGFTDISMYPMLMGGQGIGVTDLITRMIELAVMA